MAELTVIRWRDIPAQLTASDGSTVVRRELSERFQKAIDAAAMTAGLVESDAYLDGWERDVRPCSDDLEAEIAHEVERLEAAYDRSTLLALVRAGGLDVEGRPAAGERP